MSTKEKNVYLSELFLRVLGEEYSERSVIEALEKCNEEILSRLTDICGFSQDNIPFDLRQEIFDLIDVYQEFEDTLGTDVKNRFFIQRLITEQEDK